MKNKTKAIIFDLDGMIVHGERFSKRLATTFDISTDVTNHFFKEPFQLCLIGKADLKEELTKCIPAWNWQRSVDDLLDVWFSPEHNTIHGEFESALSLLHSKGVTCCLATNNEKYRTENLIVERKIGKWFDKVFSSAYLGVKKPDHSFFEEVMKKLVPFKKEEVIFWDDDDENIKGANNFGLQTEFYTDFVDFSDKIKHLL